MSCRLGAQDNVRASYFNSFNINLHVSYISPHEHLWLLFCCIQLQSHIGLRMYMRILFFSTTTVGVIYSFNLDFYLSIEISSQLNIERLISICPLPSHSSHSSHSSHETSRRSQTIKTTFCSCSLCAHKERRTSIYSLAFNHCVCFVSSSYLLLLFTFLFLLNICFGSNRQPLCFDIYLPRNK